MSWFRLDDRAAFHRKILAAGNEVAGAIWRAGAWSSGDGTDGRIPSDVAKLIAPERIWAKAQAVGLVHKNSDGWQIHDFLDWNPRGEDVKAERARKARNVADYRARAVTEAVTGNAIGHVPRPVPSRPKEKEREAPATPSAPPPVTSPARTKKPMTAMPADFCVSPEVEAMCKAQGLPDPHVVFPDFRDKAEAKQYRYANWELAFRGWMRSKITRENYPAQERETDLPIIRAEGREKYIPKPGDKPNEQTAALGALFGIGAK